MAKKDLFPLKKNLKEKVSRKKFKFLKFCTKKLGNSPVVVTGWDQEGVLSGTVTLDNSWGGVVELLLCLKLFDKKNKEMLKISNHT